MFEELKPHIIELRKRLMIAALAVLVGLLAAFAFWEDIMFWITQPLSSAVCSSGVSLSGVLGEFDASTLCADKGSMITTSVVEGLFTAFKISFFAGLTIALPIIFWQLWLFIAPGLYDNEKKYVLPFVFFATLMFLGGFLFCYYIVLPMSLNFAIYFGKGIFVYIPKTTEYIDFFLKFTFAFSLSFELPVISLFLAKINFITDKTLKDFFRYAVVLIFVFAAIITPPDVISQILMAIPLLLLYGLSILMAHLVNPYKEEDKKNTDA
ncbi:MAG: twin-arginine translocase subunit TatC [Campylobacteraceae bacterium]|nr:twin-arginine translocase subunit TatC [Campylobacteraceae bacterium]